MKNSRLNPFDILYGLNKQKLYTKEQVKESGLNTFLLLNFIRATPVLIPISSFLNQNWKMDFYNQYLLVFFTFKKLNIKNNVKWVKSEKLLKVEDLEMIQKYYYIKYKDAFDYLQKMSEEDLEHIRNFYKRGGKSDK